MLVVLGSQVGRENRVKMEEKGHRKYGARREPPRRRLGAVLGRFWDPPKNRLGYTAAGRTALFRSQDELGFRSRCLKDFDRCLFDLLIDVRSIFDRILVICWKIF